MKKLLLTFLIICGGLNLFSQAPAGFNYRALLRNNTGGPLASHIVSFRFSILKGSPVGSVAYGEKHDTSTDQFGGVSLVIGTGTESTGDFATIDWGGDSYFLMIEVDTTGGTSYFEMGTSQFLSVPFALYSNKAGNGFSGNYDDLTNKPVTNGSETKISAGSHIILAGSGTSANPYIITNGSDGSETKMSVGNDFTVSGTGTVANPYLINSKKHYIGESYGGGIVFYVYDNGRHGLIAATTDQDLGVEWYNGIKRYTNTTGDGVGSGEMNTTLIIAMQTNDNPTGNFAAKVCADYSVTVNDINYGDWYLPSKYELNLLFFQKDNVGNFSNNNYWSSTEFSSITAWCLNLTNGQAFNLNKSLPHSVRAIRAF